MKGQLLIVTLVHYIQSLHALIPEYKHCRVMNCLNRCFASTFANDPEQIIYRLGPILFHTLNQTIEQATGKIKEVTRKYKTGWILVSVWKR